MSVSDAQAPMDPGDSEPKHRVFLCHSGAEKGFVEQLDKDLRSVDQNPFFDKDRESLPIGDHFPTLIFRAIERCDVGVVFLSEEFFMRSHWPMFEVVKMVECGRRIMPIFLGISPGDLSNEEKVAKWKWKWEAWAKDNGRIDVAKWESTLRSLRPLSGLVYNNSVGEVKFREEIVKEVCKMVPSTYAWDDSHVQGMSHICKAIKEKISMSRVAKNGAQILGLYGVGGIGKTTSCKCLCSDLALEFDGRVCHVEFGDGTNELGRVQAVLKRLKSTNNEFLKEKNLDECWVLLKGQLRLKKVVLAIDNVSVNSEICDEAQKYLKLEYGKGSIVMVTARALGELENLGMKKENCLLMPELVEADARALFLYHAGVGNEADETVVMNCVRRCYFGKGDGNGSMHYHPLTLKVLGSQLVGMPPTEWQLQLEGGDVFNQRREDKNPVFSVLETSFSSLMSEDQMLFMDVALFRFSSLNEFLLSCHYPPAFGEHERNAELGLRWWSIFEWLSMVHGISVDQVKLRLNELKRRSLLEELRYGTCKIGMHDLWREFAKMKATHVVKGDCKWVYEVSKGVGLDCVLESPLGGGGWKSLRRICIEGGNFKSIKFSRCSEVTVVRLDNAYVTSGVLDLSPLKSIRSLEIHHWDKKLLATVLDLEEQIVKGIGQLSNLTYLVWFQIDEKLVSLVEISYLTNLRVLSLFSSDYTSNWTCSTVLDLHQLRYVEDVRVALRGMVSITGFNSKMKELRVLVLSGCSKLRRCVGVGNVVSLEVLLLSGCGALEELPNLQRLTRLRILDISSCVLLDALPGLGDLVALRELRTGCDLDEHPLGLLELPCMSKLTKLERLDLSGCDKLKCITGSLISLQELVVRGDCCENLHTLKDLWKLQKVTISYMHHRGRFSESSCAEVDLGMLEFVQELRIYGMDGKLTNLCKMTALKSLSVRNDWMKRLPCMGKDMRLESLKLSKCSRLRNLDVQVEVCCNWSWSNLKALRLIRCDALEVIDLSHFPQLRTLCVENDNWTTTPEFVLRCHAIHLHLDTLTLESVNMKEQLDLRRFPSLQSLEIYYCELTSLTISERSPALSRLVLSGCPKLRTVPNIDLILRLTYFRLSNCGVRLNEHGVQKLEARGFQKVCSDVFEIPSRDAALLDSRADEEVATANAPIDLDTALELCTSTFISYDESLSELGISSISKRALEMGSDEEQTKKLKNDWGADLFL